MLILQKDFITLDLIKQEKSIHEYRLDITLQINWKLKRTWMWIFRKIHKKVWEWENISVWMFNEIQNITELWTVLNVLIDLWYDIWDKSEILSIINSKLTICKD